MIIGKLVSISYNVFRAQIFSSLKSNSLNIEGDVYYFGNIGSYLKVKNNIGEVVLCEVVSVFDRDVSVQEGLSHVYGVKELELKPVGTIDKKDQFLLGVGVFPSIYSDVEIVTKKDMAFILGGYGSNDAKDGVHNSFFLGSSKNLIGYPIELSITRFFNIHSAVLGNSGSGKSNTISHILQEIFKKKSFSALGSRFLIFDVNGEYKNAFGLNRYEQNVSKTHFKPVGIEDLQQGEKKFILPHFLLSLDEWCSFLMATDATQRPFLDKVLQECYRYYSITKSSDLELKVPSYIRGKICLILNSINSQVESDTVRVTAAAGVIARLRGVLNANSKVSDICIKNGLLDDLDDLIRACGINFGQNNGALGSAIDRVLKKIEDEDYESVDSLKLTQGEYYDFEFMRIAAEMVLLEEDASGNTRVREYTSTMMTRLDFFLDNPECEFMRDSSCGIDSKDKFLDYLWGCDQNKKQLVNLDLSDLGPDSLELLTSVLTRVVYSDRKNKKGLERRENPIHLVMDEAHRYISKDGNYYLKENIFEKVAREGRKYSCFLIISSQRPSELSETVLSQCGNYIVHRIQNEIDMRYIYSVLPYFSDDFSNKIKQSIPGEALVFGNCVPMPLTVSIQKAKPGPDSDNSDIAKEWFIPDAPKTQHHLL
ncbi:ATP-binding protein [Halomonas sp. HMF6819]|uniref:ATP-binding protein n=1 Tax=Halomonas sp. HMF6819 TaxID=3373085 RepID=UPI0037B4B7EA